MYDRDVPKLTAHALASPDGLIDVVAFVLCTIRQPFQQMAVQMADVREHGAASKYLFAMKRDGYAYALAHAPVLHAAVSKAVDTGDTIAAIDVLSNIPGLGLVKAAFVAQICGLDVACLDTHNLRRLGLAQTAFKFDKNAKPHVKLEKIAAYVALCKQTGGSRKWWNAWCEYVAGNSRNRRLPDGNAVSAFHVECVCNIS